MLETEYSDIPSLEVNTIPIDAIAKVARAFTGMMLTV